MPFRYSVFYLPPASSALWRVGTAALGYSCRLGGSVGSSEPLALLLAAAPLHAGPGEPPRLRSHASLYGFHATLVAPFRPAVGERELVATLECILAGFPPAPVPALRLELLRDSFPALAPVAPPGDLPVLERALVVGLKASARETEEDDILRRGRLTARQRSYAHLWGYPYVLEEFRFHLSLGDTPDRRFLAELGGLIPPEALEPFTLDTLCLCAQPSPGAPFSLIRELPLGLSPGI